MRFVVPIFLFSICACGRLLDESDAGDAGDAALAKEVATNEAGQPLFSCGEGTHIVDCDPATQLCVLVKTSTSHAYTCTFADGGVPSCAGLPAASAKYDCGCFEDSSGEIFFTTCK